MRILASLLLVGITSLLHAQVKDPVKWSYAAKKIDAKTYEVQITAVLDPKWHIYAMEHQGDIGVATAISFNKNPLAEMKGGAKASQKPIKKKDPSTGEMVAFYEGKVVFTQTVSLKSAVNTSVSGSVEYMACDDKMCLPPTSRTFTVSLK